MRCKRRSKNDSKGGFSELVVSTESGEVTLETELALGSGSKEQEDFQDSSRFSR